MQCNRISEEQTICFLKEHEAGIPVAEFCCKPGVSDNSIYKWKAQYGGGVQQGEAAGGSGR